MLWTTSNQRTELFIVFAAGASVASGGTYTMCNSNIAYGGLGLSQLRGQNPPSLLRFAALAQQHDLQGYSFLVLCAPAVC